MQNKGCTYPGRPEWRGDSTTALEQKEVLLLPSWLQMDETLLSRHCLAKTLAGHSSVSQMTTKEEIYRFTCKHELPEGTNRNIVHLFRRYQQIHLQSEGAKTSNKIQKVYLWPYMKDDCVSDVTIGIVLLWDQRWWHRQSAVQSGYFSPETGAWKCRRLVIY